ncbi:EamA family transporter [Bacillus benzoevorans]|uniref:Drug/metabolite transporter (DMT)-like permease n=1 Tax=Bacillus benzoevorans TaxID=1456 RepID=A0A7X0HSE7_9BACI|nr:EamA family transporter [Bacillus benzoevorans]MBB6446025.1 drug/metabolite transporter (DMT)-like permease [Bacillus benzoevorans]
MNIKDILLILANTLMLVVGQFLWKSGVDNKQQEFSSLLGIVKLVFSPPILGGLVLYAFATVLWLYILSRVSLSLAYPLQSLAYIITVFASYFIFKEPITAYKIAGCLLILAGISLISLTTKA